MKGPATLVTIAAIIVLLGGAWWLTQGGTGENMDITNDSALSTTTASWSSTSDNTLALTFKYPENLGTTYIHTTDWPPQFALLDQAFTCSPAGNETERAGATTRREVGGRTYCVTEVVEGAAGSIYTQYAYAYAEGDDTNILTFSLRRPQCGNYNEDERILCEAEQSSFSIDNLVNQIVDTIQYN